MLTNKYMGIWYVVEWDKNPRDVTNVTFYTRCPKYTMYPGDVLDVGDKTDAIRRLRRGEHVDDVCIDVIKQHVVANQEYYRRQDIALRKRCRVLGWETSPYNR